MVVRKRDFMLEASLFKRLGNLSIEAELSVEEPSVTVLFGRSGAGKSSIVKMLAGLMTPDRGRIAFGDKVFFDSAARVNLPPELRGVGYLFQEHRLFPHLSVKRNLTFGRFPGNRRSSLDLDEVVGLLNISHLLGRGVGALSGGESQRVALGRALLSCTSFLVMDEPLSSLDEAIKGELLDFIACIPERYGFHTIYITHDRSEAARLAKRIFLVKDGRLVLFSGKNKDFISYQNGDGTSS
jgi:molybdate transport system ATP-binding protein